MKDLERITAYHTQGIMEHTGKEGLLACTFDLNWVQMTEKSSESGFIYRYDSYLQVALYWCVSLTKHSYSNFLCMYQEKLWRKWPASKHNLVINISSPELRPDSSEESACWLLLRRRNDLPTMPVLPPAECPAPRQKAIRWPKLQFLDHISSEAAPGWCQVSLFSDTKCRFEITGNYQFYWVGLTLKNLKRNFHFIFGYIFSASYIQKWLFLLPAWQCISQNPFHRLLYILKLVSEEGNLPVIFLPFSWKRIRHIYCPCICNHGKVSYLLWCLCGNAAVFSWKCVRLLPRAFRSINIFTGTFLTDVLELNSTIFSANLGLCVL